MVLALSLSLCAKTRWSSLYLVPDADLLASGEFLVSFDGFASQDSSSQTLLQQNYLFRFGVTEWVNIHAGHAGGPTLGFKARILGETSDKLPSLAVGAHNLFYHKDANFTHYQLVDTPSVELYAALGKNFDALRTRLHVGVQTMPGRKADEFNPYGAIEKYFGWGWYASVIGYRREQAFRFSAFTNLRLFDQHLEFTAGAVDLLPMFADGFSLAPSQEPGFSRPGFWFGLRFQHAIDVGSTVGLRSIEERLREQELALERLRGEVDSVRAVLRNTREDIDQASQSVRALTDSAGGGSERMRTVLLEKIVDLKALYTADHFEPEKVRQAIRGIKSFGYRAVPYLKEILLDRKVDRHVRMYSAALLGEIGNRQASDALLDVIAQTGDTDIRVEILIALGKMKETRAMYLMEHLANDPDDAVALTAQEVLKRLSRETGARISEGTRMRPILPSSQRPQKQQKPILSKPPEKTPPPAQDTAAASDASFAEAFSDKETTSGDESPPSSESSAAGPRQEAPRIIPLDKPSRPEKKSSGDW
jgi:hypothetical protein